MSKRQITGGAFQDSAGRTLTSGTATFRLSVDAVASGIQVMAEVLSTAVLDSNGNISGTVYLWPNDQLVPANTTYRIKVYTSQGQLVWKSENSIPSGAGSFDLGTLVPVV